MTPRLSLLILSLFLVYIAYPNIEVAVAQNANKSNDAADCSIRLRRAKGSFILSFGVLNNKAIDLVKPEYPNAARHVGAHGSVQVRVLIDPRGCVNEAKVHRGHPLLISASLRAAARSRFSPFTIGGTAVWVSGVIVYNFLPVQLNWLELGYHSDSAEKLMEYLPPDFDTQRTELRTSQKLENNERTALLRSVSESIRTKLSTNPKHQWLFAIGRELKLISLYDLGPDGREVALKRIQELIDVAPSSVSARLVFDLEELIHQTDVTIFWKKLKEMENRMYNLGR